MNRSRIPLHSAAPGDSTPKVSFPLLGGHTCTVKTIRC